MSESLLWVEKYRPRTIEDCILPESIKKTLRDVVSQNKIPNMMFTGTSGIGKTTAARAICNETQADYLIINGSDEGRMIDTLRTKLTQFCSTISLSGSRKVVIIDEADYMNADSVQPAMRNFTERFADNCSFIFTCNYKNRIIEPIHSRCAVIDFSLNLTGLATYIAGDVVHWMRATSETLSVGGGSLFIFVSLLVTMLLAILLGMGMPTVPAYLNVALLMGPLLVGLGVAMFTAHMFVFYFAVHILSLIKN